MDDFFSFKGIPINVSTNKISMAREFPLPERRLIGTWEMVRSIGKSKRMIKLPFEEEAVTFDDPEQVTVHKGTIGNINNNSLLFCCTLDGIPKFYELSCFVESFDFCEFS